MCHWAKTAFIFRLSAVSVELVWIFGTEIWLLWLFSMSLDPGGFIVVHDCNPLTESASAPGTSLVATVGLHGFGEMVWNGDVWKTIAYLRSYRHDLNVFVLNCVHGLGIITKGKPENVLNMSTAEIDKMTFYDLDNNREQILNLKSP